MRELAALGEIGISPKSQSRLRSEGLVGWSKCECVEDRCLTPQLSRALDVGDCQRKAEKDTSITTTKDIRPSTAQM